MNAKIWLKNDTKQALYKIGEADTDDGILEILKYWMKGTGNVDNVLIESPDGSKWLSGTKVAAKYHLTTMVN